MSLDIFIPVLMGTIGVCAMVLGILLLLQAWQAAIASERERCAKIAEKFVGRLTAEEFPPVGLAPAENRFDGGISAKVAQAVARAIRRGEGA